MKVPFLTYNEPQVEIPTTLTDIARTERFAQANTHEVEEMATDAELYLYLLSKHHSEDRNREDSRLMAHVICRLCEKYPDCFPNPGPRISQYATLGNEQQRRLALTRAYLQAEKDRYYEHQLKDYAEHCFGQFGSYIDPHFIVDPDSANGGDPKGQ